MNRDDIIRMAEEAGFQYYQTFKDGDVCVGDECGSLVKFAQLVAAHEREECAQIADIAATKMPSSPSWRGAFEGVAFLIRART